MKNNKYLVVFVTVPFKKHILNKIINHIIGKKLVACVNVIKNINSFYWWKEKICCDKESLLIIKTHSKVFDNLVKEIKKIHPYEIPEIIAIPILRGNKDYLNWIYKSVKI